MNILFFSRFFFPHIGGVEKHVLEVGNILVKKGHKVTVVTEELPTKDIPVYLQSRRKLSRHDAINSIEVFRIPVGRNNWFKKFRIWSELWKHRRLLESADIIHCHDVFFWYLPFRFLYFRKPVFTTFHGYESYPLKSRYILVRKMSEKLSIGNICIGDFIKKWYGTKPDYVTYGGVNIVKSEMIKVKSPDSAVFIGRLDEQTGLETYINAVKLIRKKIPDFKFQIIGDGKFRKEIEKDFRNLGFQENSKKYFSKYHFAFVSRYLSILEAMAAKRLVFAVYDNPLKEDYLKLAPFAKYINIVGSKEEISSLILYFLNHPDDEKKIVDKAFEWVRMRSWDKVAKLYVDLWRQDL